MSRLGPAAGFGVLTIALTWPQTLLLNSGIGAHYDALFSIWRLAWLAHQLPRDPWHLFDANIFHPEPNALAYSDALLLPGVLGAPAMWAGVNPIVVYNTLLLASFVLCGLLMYQLVHSLTRSPVAAWVSGVVFAFTAYRFAHYSHFELLWGCWIPLAWWALHRVLATARVRDGVLLGAVVALQAWSCLYYSVFLVTSLVVLGVALLLVGPNGIDPARENSHTDRATRHAARLIAPALAAVLVCAILVGPYALPYLRNRGTVGVRPESDVRGWSPTFANYLVANRENRWYRYEESDLGPHEGVLFPGIVATGLAATGLIFGGRRERWAYAIVLIVSIDLSLGFNGVMYPALYRWVPPYDGLRVPARMFAIVSAALAVLAGMGGARIASVLRPRWRMAVGGALVAAVCVETLSTPIGLQRVPRRPAPLYVWLRDQPRAPLFEWPVPRVDSLGVTDVPRYMYYSTWHWQPLVNGYSGEYPARYVRLLADMEAFPAPSSLGRLREIGTRYVLLHSEPDPEGYTALRLRLDASPELSLQMIDRVGSEDIALYVLR